MFEMSKGAASFELSDIKTEVKKLAARALAANFIETSSKKSKTLLIQNSNISLSNVELLI